MQTSDLDERIEIQETVTTKQSNGEVIKSDQVVHSLWSKTVPLRGGESQEGDKTTYKQKYRFITRYVTGITTKHTVKWNGLVYDIKAVNPYHKAPRNEFIAIEAETII